MDKTVWSSDLPYLPSKPESYRGYRVYIWYENLCGTDIPLYIGASSCVFHRLYQHHKKDSVVTQYIEERLDWPFDPCPNYPECDCIPRWKVRLIDTGDPFGLETRLIKSINPVLNGTKGGMKYDKALTNAT